MCGIIGMCGVPLVVVCLLFAVEYLRVRVLLGQSFERDLGLGILISMALLPSILFGGFFGVWLGARLVRIVRPPLHPDDTAQT